MTTAASGSPSDNGSPVFVDDSGRRLARARLVIRLVLGLLGGYVVLVAIGLAGSASLPAVHLADLGRLPTRSAASPRLGAGAQQVALPAALRPATAASRASAGPGTVAPNPANPSRAQNPGGSGPGAGPGNSPNPGSPQGVSTTSTSPHGPTTTIEPGTTTTSTAVPTTTTTVAKVHGPPTSVAHGPPPGHGHKPS